MDPQCPLLIVRGGASDESVKTEVPSHTRCDTIKTPPWLRIISTGTEHRSNLCCPSPAMVTFPYAWNIFERNQKQYIINQSVFCFTQFPESKFHMKVYVEISINLFKFGHKPFKAPTCNVLCWIFALDFIVLTQRR